MAADFNAVALGPQKKVAAIGGLTNELAEQRAEEAEAVVDLATRDAAAGALDAAVFSTAAASDIRPAGLLAGVDPIAATAGGAHEAMVHDLTNLAGATADAGGCTSMMLFANPRQAIALDVRTNGTPKVPVTASPRLAAGTVVAVELGAIASG